MEIKKTYPAYRYVILVVFMLLTASTQIQWLTHAAVARPADAFYQGQFNPSSFMNIDFLAMVYMLVFIIMSFPASYIIDTYGIKIGLGIGAILMAAFGLLKAYYAQSFWGIVIAQTGLAIAQPFILNAVTALSVRWFPLTERALAAGLASLAQYLGILVAMLLTPQLIGTNPDLPNYGQGFEKMLWIYGIFTFIAAILSLIFIKEQPKGIELEKIERLNFKNGLKHIVFQRDMMITIFMFFIGLGIFNAVSSMTDAIAKHAGIKDSDGLIGGLMLIGGIIGAIIIPALSDKYRKRKAFLVLCIFGLVPGVFGLAFPQYIASTPESIYTVSLVSSFILGFFVMSAGPIGFQYAAEVSYPAQESSSQGILLWVGQLTGIVFVAGMSVHNNEYLGEFMAAFALLSLLILIAVFFLRESPMILQEKK